MDSLAEFATTFWNALNYPIINLGKSSVTLWAIILTISSVLIFVFISARAKNWLIERTTKKGLHVSNWRAVITLSYYAVLAIGLFSILQSSGLDLSIFTVLTGAIGIGIGFGMQTIFSNFISGIIILLERPIKLGDRIEVGEVSGNVKSISVRATSIITNDNVSIIVPNSDFISKQVINWTHSDHSVRIRTSVSVSYDSDPEVVQKLLLQIADAEPGVLKAPAPTVRLTDFGESGLNFSLLVWTQDYSDRSGALKSLLNFKILNLFRENKILMPFPQRDIFIRNISALTPPTTKDPV